jgi:hypothetical protein
MNLSLRARAAVHAAAFVLTASSALAQDAGEAPTGSEPATAAKANEAALGDLRFVVAGGYAHFFATDFDSIAGDVAVDRGFAGLEISGKPNDTYSWDLPIHWEGSWYDFGGGATLAGAEPWDAVQSISIAPGANFTVAERWRISARVLLQFSGENDADAGDSFMYGGILGAAYRFDEKLTLGAGVLVSSRIEEDALVIPQILVDWRPCKEFRLSNFAGPEAYPGGAGLEGIWVFSEEFEVALGGRYQYRRFRLDDSGPAFRANGVGTDEGLPVWLRATMRAKCGARVDLVAGMQFMGEMSLDDADGNELASVDVDPAPFIGAFFSWKY